MKDFKFSLDRMRGYKAQLLDREKAELSRCRRQEQEIEVRIEHLASELSGRRRELEERQRQGMEAGELGVYSLFLESGRLHREELDRALAQAAAESERQLQTVVAASQDVASLDKLEDRQREEYRVLAGRENEKLISEFVSGQVVRGIRPH